MPEPHPPAETWRKVGVREGDHLVVVHAPPTWTPASAPAGVHASRRRGSRRAEVLVAFFSSLGALEREAAALAESIAVDGMVWVAWPRKAAGHVSDLSENAVRAAMLPAGVVDVKVAMLDEDWSGLKFMWRRELRAARRR